VKQRQLDEERIAGLEQLLLAETEARHGIEHSISWRVTRPLRAVRGLFPHKR
jgi:hypothetical protein